MATHSILSRVGEELRAQLRYQRGLATQIGTGPALRARLGAMLDRVIPGHVTHVTALAPGLRHPVALRAGSSDLHTFYEVLRQGIYAPLGDLDPEVIVDCGANAGFASAWFLSRFPRARVIAIEPFAANAALCRRNLAPYGARAEVREAAVWSHACRLVVEARPGEEWGVQVRPARADEAGDVEAIGLADLGLPRIDLLKVDIEGSEVELFGHGAEAWLPHVGHIAIELHGEAAESAFRAALAEYEGSWSTSRDMTLVRDLRRRGAV